MIISRTRTGALGGVLTTSILLLWAAAGLGWVLNIVKIVWAINDPITAMFVIRCCGTVLFPIGCVLGWL